MLAYSKFGNGEVTVTTTAAPINTSYTVYSSVSLQNDMANTVDIFIGDQTSQTFRLVPGQSVTIPIDYLKKIYVKTASGTAKLTYITVGT